MRLNFTLGYIEYMVRKGRKCTHTDSAFEGCQLIGCQRSVLEQKAKRCAFRCPEVFHFANTLFVKIVGNVLVCAHVTA